MNREHVERWRDEQLRRSGLTVESVSVDRLHRWSFVDGRLAHASGGFFSIVGVKVTCSGTGVTTWQPFIDQPEIGILGFMLARRDGDICLLVQAKTEPGNHGGVQLAPSFQCTESNYLRRHGGAQAPFYEHFAGGTGAPPATDTLQSEQGTRFLDKYNRNMVVEVAPDAVDLDRPELAAWRWLPVASLRELIRDNALFNTDARSVIAVSSWELFSSGGAPFARWAKTDGFGYDLGVSYHGRPSPGRISEITSWLESRRRRLAVVAERVPLDDLPGWRVAADGIVSARPEAMAVRYYAVQALDREVPRWCQPLITSGTPGTVVLLGQRRSGVLRFLLRASPEPGFANAAQLSASFQSFPGDPPDAAARSPLLRVGETGAPPGYRVAMECVVSEEGGRFFRELNRYVVAVAPPEAPVDDDPDQAWLTLGEITALKPTPGVFTNELRSVLSLLVHYV